MPTEKIVQEFVTLGALAVPCSIVSRRLWRSRLFAYDFRYAIWKDSVLFFVAAAIFSVVGYLVSSFWIDPRLVSCLIFGAVCAAIGLG